MNTKLIVSLIGVSGVLLTANHASRADEWYGGVEAGQIQENFHPHYTFASGKAPRSFNDSKTGLQIALIGGRRFAINEHWSLAGQLRLAFNDAKWSLDTSEPATISYKMPYTTTLSLVPEYQIANDFSLFGEVGIGKGKVEEQKSSPTASSYHASPLATVETLGLGARYRLGQHSSVYLAYRYEAYAKFSYSSHLPNGTVTETIDDSPDSSAWTAGVSFRY